MTTDRFWEGDGRNMVQPIDPMPNTRPAALRRSQCRDIIRRLQHHRYIYHTFEGRTLWVTMAYLDRTSQTYTLKVCKKVLYRGYYIIITGEKS